MKFDISGLRGKLMVGSALIAASVLATPAALAGNAYPSRNNSHDADVFGALVVGALIGGVLVAATEHHHDYGYYYPNRGYYAPTPAAYYTAPYYGGAYYGGPSYYRPAPYAYGYGYPRHGSNVNLTIYSNRGHSDHGWYGSPGYYGRDNHHAYRGSNGDTRDVSHGYAGQNAAYHSVTQAQGGNSRGSYYNRNPH